MDAGAGPADPGHISFMMNGHAFLLEATVGATPVDITAALDALAPRPSGNSTPEVDINISPDGRWLAISTERFAPDCNGWACLAVVRSDLSAGGVVTTPTGVVHPDTIAVGAGGTLVVYSDDNAELQAVSQTGATWGTPTNLTTASPYAFHRHPAVSDDGASVLFNCSNQSFPSHAICEVARDGTGFRTVITRNGGPVGMTSGDGVHHADYAPDGSIVFEAEFGGGEQIWRLAPGAAVPTLVTNTFSNDNSPCVLPDGRIASLWLDRPGAMGVHELKVMDGNGASHVMLLVDLDVFDGGTGCGM